MTTTHSSRTTAGVVLKAVVIVCLIFAYGCADKDNPPELKLIGPNPTDALYGVPYVDRGIVAFDREDLQLDGTYEVIQDVDPFSFGEQTYIMKVTDHHGNSTEISRRVNVVHSALSLAGNFESTSGQACGANGVNVVVSSLGGRPDSLVITGMGNPGNPSIYFGLENGSWYYSRSSNVSCQMYNGGMTYNAGGNVIQIDLTVHYGSGNYIRSITVYTRH